MSELDREVDGKRTRLTEPYWNRNNLMCCFPGGWCSWVMIGLGRRVSFCLLSAMTHRWKMKWRLWLMQLWCCWWRRGQIITALIGLCLDCEHTTLWLKCRTSVSMCAPMWVCVQESRKTSLLRAEKRTFAIFWPWMTWKLSLTKTESSLL